MIHKISKRFSFLHRIDKNLFFYKEMIQEKLICHASGDFSKPFIIGFYLYHIVPDKDAQKGILSNYLVVNVEL